MSRFRYLILSFLSFLIISCQSTPDFIPKPYGYHRIELPPHDYQAITGDYPYTFRYSTHAQVLPDTFFMAEPYWIEVQYPKFNCSISISYKPIKSNFDSLIGYFGTSHKLTYKHNIRATAIDEYRTTTPKGSIAVIYELEGDVPSQFQYFITDSTTHFLRAALYFPTSTKNDSLAPVIEYVKKDMLEMLNTTEWKKGNKK